MKKNLLAFFRPAMLLTTAALLHHLAFAQVKIASVKVNKNVAYTSNVENWYQVIVVLELKQMNCYHIKQIDIDDNARFYPVRSIRFSHVPRSISLYPVPAKNTLVIDENGEKISGTLMLVDAAGRIVLQTNISPANVTRIDISKLAVGMYVYSLNNLKGSFVKE